MSKLKLSLYKKPDAVINFLATSDAITPIAQSLTELFNDFQTLPQTNIDIFCKVLNFIFDTKAASLLDIDKIIKTYNDNYAHIVDVKNIVSKFANDNDVQQAQLVCYEYLLARAQNCPLKISLTEEIRIFLVENDLKTDIESDAKATWDEAVSEEEARKSDIIARMFAEADSPDSDVHQATAAATAAVSPSTTIGTLG